MIQGTENIHLGDLISRRIPFNVPKYQRAFAWDEEEITDFIKDLQELFKARRKDPSSTKRHFFGGLVSVDKLATGTKPGRVYEVVDGQQRLATFFLAIALLIKGLRKLQTEADPVTSKESGSHADTSRDDYLEYKEVVSGGVQPRLRLTLSKADNAFFQALIKGESPLPTRDSHRRLQSASARIEKELVDPIFSENALTAGQKLESLLHLRSCIMEDCHLIHIVSDDRNEAYKLFSILNDRGRTLSDGDLLRSYTMELLEYHQADQVQVEEAWDQILSHPEDKIEDYLRTYYASHHGERAPKRDLADSFYQRLFLLPHRPIESSSVQEATAIKNRIEGMKREERVYLDIDEGCWPYEESKISVWERDRLLRLVKVLRHTLCFPLLLSCKDCLTEEQFSQIVGLIERFVFRYINIVGGHPGKLANIYYSHAKEIRKNPTKYKLKLLKKDLLELQERDASDSLFEANLALKMAYNRSSGRLIKHFLTTIEDHHKWYNHGASGKPKPDLTRVFDLDQIDIEHVYPQNPAAPIPNLEVLKHDIGNLTFWAPNDNRAAGRLSFAAKKPRYKNSGVVLTRQIARLSKWSEEAVLSRRKKLLEMSNKVFTV